MTEFYNNIKYQSVEEVEQNLKAIQNEIQQLPTTLTKYLKYVQEGGLEMKSNGSVEEQIGSLESVLDRMKEIVQQKKTINQQKEIILKNIVEIFQNSMLEKNDIENYHDKVVFQLVRLEEERHAKRMTELKSYFCQEIKDEMKDIVDHVEIQQLQEWTEKKCDEIVFDSEKDNWSVNSSVFDDKVKGKKDLIFLIESDDGDKFGGYVTATINGTGSWIKDENSFVFSLKKMNEIEKRMKFEIKENCAENAFYMDSKSNDNLFKMGYYNYYYNYYYNSSIQISKRNNTSYCQQKNDVYDFHDVENAFIPKCMNNYREFTPKRITVIQMK